MDRLQRVFSLSGRVSRLGFWRFQVRQALALAAAWCLTIFATMLGGRLGLLPSLLLPAIWVAGAMVCARRLHDRGRSAWWAIAFLAGPYLLLAVANLMLQGNRDRVTALATLPLSLGAVALAVWGWIEIGFRRGTRGANTFGPEPR